mgnify:CR=1 FL=1
MSTLSELLNWGKQVLSLAGVPDAGLDAWYLMEYVFQLDRAHYFLQEKDMADPKREEKYRVLVGKRSSRIPLQHLTHQAWFMGLEYYVDERVLVPRQDTEILVEEAVKRLKPGQKILDMCTGSGCILLSILKFMPDCEGKGVDISESALEVARINGKRLNIPAVFSKSDLFEQIDGYYDMIVSNPPYIPTSVIGNLEDEVRRFDPALALHGGEDGLDFYRRLIGTSWNYLSPGGWLLLEIGHDQKKAVLRMMEEAGYREPQSVKDLAGHDRVVMGRKDRRNEDV